MASPRWSVALVIVGSMLAVDGLTRADDESRTLRARLGGYNETPSVSSTGSGDFRCRISKDEQAIDYELTYEDLEGATVLFAHIHLGERHIAGGVAAFLCGGGGKPACPPSPGGVRGRITAADVVGPAAQGLAAGELDELIRAMRSGAAYANVHTDKQPSGEIRGQIRDGD